MTDWAEGNHVGDSYKLPIGEYFITLSKTVDYLEPFVLSCLQSDMKKNYIVDKIIKYFEHNYQYVYNKISKEKSRENRDSCQMFKGKNQISEWR